MPSGKTHDAITYILAIPTFFVAFYATRSPLLAGLATLSMLFAGLMFGPDLDTISRPYARWGLLRWIWWPYRKLLAHRSRLSHGLVFSTPFRIFYFFIVLTLMMAVSMYVQDVFLRGMPASPEAVVKVTQESTSRMVKLITKIDFKILIVLITGLWWGAATHSISDFVTTGFKRRGKSGPKIKVL